MEETRSNWNYIDADIDELTNVPSREGIYVFVATETFEMDLKSFNSEVTGIFYVNGEETKVTLGVPPCNIKNDKIRINKEEVFYVGSSKKINNRIKAHLDGNKINNTVALKLGFKTRNYVKKKMKIYYKVCDVEKGRDLEKKIRAKYNVVFGT